MADLGEKELMRCIAYVDESAQQTGNKNKWKDWNLVIRKCHREGWGLKGFGNKAPIAEPCEEEIAARNKRDLELLEKMFLK